MSDVAISTASPVGTIELHFNSHGAVTRLSFGGTTGSSPIAAADAPAEAAHVLEQLEAYFSGSLRRFDVPVEASGTDFQKEVWSQLRQIPYGETSTYGEIARRMGMKNGQRAVGGANGANPVAIIIPCHRVIGADGSLTGFGGGIEIKRALLRLEGSLPPETGRLF